MIRYPLFEETAIQMGSLAGIAANKPNSGARSNEPKRLYQMPYGVVTAVVIGALAWSAGSVLAGTCANDIAQVEAALDALTAAGPGRAQHISRPTRNCTGSLLEARLPAAGRRP